MTLKQRLQKNLEKQPHSVLTLLLLGLAALIAGVALLPDNWLLKVVVALWVLLP